MENMDPAMIAMMQQGGPPPAQGLPPQGVPVPGVPGQGGVEREAISHLAMLVRDAMVGMQQNIDTMPGQGAERDAIAQLAVIMRDAIMDVQQNIDMLKMQGENAAETRGLANSMTILSGKVRKLDAATNNLTREVQQMVAGMEIRVNDEDMIQYKIADEWKDLISKNDLKGKDGAPGLRGRSGAGMTPNLTPGTVEELPSGADPYVTITGTRENPVINFGIPTGTIGEEIDPTVPAWAKEETKPTYTAAEVGALPDTSVIPERTSELVNDSGFLSEETDPTVPGWAKEEAKPIYTALEVGALPNTTVIPEKVSDLENDSGFLSAETDPTVPIWAKAAQKPDYTAAEVGAAPATHTHVAGDIADLLERVYPVGAIYISTTNTTPATLLGGVWERYAAGRVLVGVDELDSDFTAGATGGAKTHTLLTSEMPSHDHSTLVRESETMAKATGSDSFVVSSQGTRRTGSTGGGQPHNNLQPYIAVYMWVRTA